MILTGNEIKRAIECADIVIYPFDESQINPNSYNYKLGRELIALDGDTKEFLTIPQSGFVLHPGKLYLGHTMETLGSELYAMSLIGRSSLGRLGMFLQLSADLGHTKSSHEWTLEIYVVQPVRVYEGMKIGQITFWKNIGKLSTDISEYSKNNGPVPSKLNL